MPIARCAWLVSALVVAMAGTTAAQAPTPPSDTLHANFAPRFRLEPDPERVPAAPGDTLEAVPGPAWPDALFGEPEEVPIPPRIAGLRLA
jgi:hypothetical protein